LSDYYGNTSPNAVELAVWGCKPESQKIPS
jgi:hypothetical protein